MASMLLLENLKIYQQTSMDKLVLLFSGNISTQKQYSWRFPQTSKAFKD